MPSWLALAPAVELKIRFLTHARYDFPLPRRSLGGHHPSKRLPFGWILYTLFATVVNQILEILSKHQGCKELWHCYFAAR